MKAHRRPVSGCGSQRMLHALERRSHSADHGPSFASLYSPFCRYATSSPDRGKSLLAGGGQLSCNSRTGQIKNPPSECSGSYHGRHSYRVGPATTTTAASGRCREELLGQRPARRTCRPRHARMLGAATRGTKQQPTGLIAYPAAQGRAVRFPCGLHETATTLDIPTGWDPNTKKEPTGLFFAACGRPCSFDSSYGLHEKIPDPKIRDFFHDPYGNRTHVTAVKGPCLNRLTNGPYKYRASLKPPTLIIHYCGRPSPLS